ncbi:YhdB [Bacillus tequilensis]|nr:YhdB [Bacillus tequilensis]
MDYADYDKALYYTHRSQWDNLLILMVRTEDDLLSKTHRAFSACVSF